MQFYAINTSYTFVILFFSFPEPPKQIFYCKVYYSIIITNYVERVKFSFVKYQESYCKRNYVITYNHSSGVKRKLMADHGL